MKFTMVLKALVFVICVCFCFANVEKKPKYIRPCHLQNYKCIREYLADNSHCKIPIRRTMTPFYKVDVFRFDAPYFNASYVERDLLVIGQDRCFVSEFSWNEAGNSGVLGIDCPWLTFESNRTLYQHWQLKADSVYSYSFEGTYPLIRLTTTLGNANGIDFCRAFTFAYVARIPYQRIIPLNKPTANFLSRDGKVTNIYERETFYWRASMLARRFVNNMLCDFGCY